MSAPLRTAVNDGLRLDRALLALINDARRLYREGLSGCDGRRRLRTQFDALAMDLFAYQFGWNEPYRRFCESRGVYPEQVAGWRDIPPVPIAAFRRFDMSCVPLPEVSLRFRSSGTTDAAQRARHHLAGASVYESAAETAFEAYVLPDGADLRFFVLFPPFEELPDSSLAYFLQHLRRRFGSVGSDHFVHAGRLEVERLTAAARAAERAPQPVCLIGTSFSFVHWFDACREEGLRFRFPPGSRLIDTGGFKGRSREVTPDQIRQLARETMGIEPQACINYYGMAELCSQHYDATIRRAFVPGEPSAGKVSPLWTRVRVLDPETMTEVDVGGTGLVAHFDLANRNSVCAILTEDLGCRTDGGFELIGRARGAEARGCSLAMDARLGVSQTGPVQR